MTACEPHDIRAGIDLCAFQGNHRLGESATHPIEPLWVRLSIGIEHIDDLLADLSQAFEAV